MTRANDPTRVPMSMETSGREASQDDAPERPERRRFLTTGAATLAGTALAGGALTGTAAAQEPEKSLKMLSEMPPLSADGAETDEVQVLDAETFFQELPQMRVISSPDDMFETTLEATTVDRVVPSPKGLFRFQARSYGADPVGAQLRVRPGQTLMLRFVNPYGWNETRDGNLCPSDDHNVPNCLNTTNIHTHGLHVSPSEPSDDVFIAVWPKDDPEIPKGDPRQKNGSFQYVFQIPWDHAPGTHWYHAHRHGSTAFNVSQNQFGSLIVEEPKGQEILPGVHEETLILAEALHRQPDAQHTAATPRDMPAPLFTVNGVNLPTIRMRPNQIQRWRLISASGTRVGYNPLAFQGDFRVWLVAWDGITLSGPPRPLNPKEPLVLAPGNRADVLIQAPPKVASGKIVRLGSQAFSTCDSPGNGFPNPQLTSDADLAMIEVSGTPAEPRDLPKELPASKSAYLRPIFDAEVDRNPKREVTFVVTGGRGTDDRFRVGYKDDRGGSFGPAPYGKDFAIRVPYGNVEEWTIRNDADQDHPFHIHVNPFQIVEIRHKDGSGEVIPEDRRLWSDTVNVPRRGFVRIRSRFVDFRGRYVLHCHILNHEDRGMMMDVEVV